MWYSFITASDKSNWHTSVITLWFRYDLAQLAVRAPTNLSNVVIKLLGVRFPVEANFYDPTTFLWEIINKICLNQKENICRKSVFFWYFDQFNYTSRDSLMGLSVFQQMKGIIMLLKRQPSQKQSGKFMDSISEFYHLTFELRSIVTHQFQFISLDCVLCIFYCYFFAGM